MLNADSIDTSHFFLPPPHRAESLHLSLFLGGQTELCILKQCEVAASRTQPHTSRHQPSQGKPDHPLDCIFYDELF